MTASTAALSCASTTSVGWISGFEPAARPISAYWLVEKVLVTVNAPVGASSSPSCTSRSASVAGSAIASGAGAAVAAREVILSEELVSWVLPANSLTWPVTSTWSPICGYVAKPELPP